MARWAGAGDDSIQELMRNPLWKEAVIVALMTMMISSKEARDLDPMVLELPTNAEGIEVEIRSDSKTVLDWINGHAKQKKRQ